MIHVSTEGIEFESSDVESKEPDWKAAYDEMMSYFHSLNTKNVTGAAALVMMRKCRDKHTPKPETLEDVVREYVALPRMDTDNRRQELFTKMRELTKGEK